VADIRAAGVLFVAGGRVLLLKRAATDKDHPNTWGLPGGHIEEDENAAAAATREVREETGFSYTGPKRRLWTSDDGFVVFGASLDKPFRPALNAEHTAARWAPFDDLPTPLHPALAKELAAMPKIAQDKLIEGSSNAARSKNIATEIQAGKDPKQAAAIAYSVQRKASDGASRHPALDALHRIAADCLRR
jgi:8-oxo-dGTP pyrophosphatase MutT (NUDIX family)